MVVINPVFIVATPLQVLMVFALLRQLNVSGRVDVLVVGYFSDAKNVVIELNNAFGFIGDFRYFEKYNEAVDYYISSGRRFLYLHWDVGFKTNIFIKDIVKKISDVQLFVYEEGVGTYRGDIYKGFKRKVMKVLGLPVVLGGHRDVKGIYVYDPALYIKTEGASVNAMKILFSIGEVVDLYRNELVTIFDSTGFLSDIPKKHRECIVYLSSWEIDFNFLKKIMSGDGLFVLKPHPHIVDDVKVERNECLVCPAAIPAELLINILSAKCESVKIFHHGSSVERYIGGSNIEYIRV